MSNQDFTGPAKATVPTIKNQAKFVKKVAVPKSANYKSSGEGAWGKSA